MSQTNGTLAVALWVEGIEPARQAYVYEGFICDKSAAVRASSSDQQFTLELLTNPLGRELLAKFERLEKHGFTVIDVPDHWTDEYRRPRGWVENVIIQALDQVMRKPEKVDIEGEMALYDEALALEVLAVLNKRYPNQVNMLDVKHSLADEPSDVELLTALQGLLLEGYVTGDSIPEHQSGRRKLGAMMKVRITKEGRQHLSGSPPATQPSVTHQYNNFGQSGAMGPHSVGTINYQQHWAANQVDLSQVVSELQTLKAELLKTAKTADDYGKVSLIAQAEECAEKDDGSKMLEVLSRSGRWAFDFATEVGTDITAKLLAKSMGLEP